MEFKLIHYRATEPTDIIDIPFLAPRDLQVNDVFYYEDKKYKVLAIKFTAVKAEFDENGARKYPPAPDRLIKVNPLKDWQLPEVTVTEIPLL